MPRRPPPTRRWLTALSWPVGIALTSWDYIWRSTPMHRRELLEATAEEHLPPPYPAGVDAADVLGAEHGRGPLFHRRYRTQIRASTISAPELVSRLQSNLNQAAPTKFARFQKLHGRARRDGGGGRVRGSDAGSLGRAGARDRHESAVVSPGDTPWPSRGGPDRVPRARWRSARVRDRVVGAQRRLAVEPALPPHR